MINTLYTWIDVHHSLLVPSFAIFLNFCSSFSSEYGFSCILPIY